MEYKKNVIGIREARALEDSAAKAAKLEANLEYLSMMTDVDLDEDENEEGADEN